MGKPVLQGEINDLVAQGRVAEATAGIIARRADYGTGNYVLYHLDRALVLQLSGDYAGSIASIAQARARHESLYTASLGKEALTWLVNDTLAPYRAPEYERVLMNVFQVFNYLHTDNLNEALVEARDLDAKAPAPSDAYAPPGRRFEDNGFARLLCGILYEATGDAQDRSDALVAYRQALAGYDAYYGGSYVPAILQEGLVRLAARLDDPDLGMYRDRFGRARPGDDEQAGATVYLLEAVGFSPVKVEDMLPVPLDGNIVTKLALPRFVPRPSAVQASRMVFKDQAGGVVSAVTELGIDIADIANKDLEARKALVLAKALSRPALKYLVERNQREAIAKKHGQMAGDIFGLLSSLYNLYTEQADLRSWQSLPAQVRVARSGLAPGVYHVNIEDLDIVGNPVANEEKGQMDLRAGQTYFLLRRSLR